LLDTDPAYREHFQRVWVEIMNHRLTPGFLDERYRHYHDLAVTLGIEDRDFLVPLHRFLTDRPTLVWHTAERWLGTGASIKVTIAGSGGAIDLDGRRVAPGWAGRYFPGMPVRLGVPPEHRHAFSHWLINGRVVPDDSLTIRTTGPLVVEPVWTTPPSVPAAP
jgi:hypothetical protein